MTLGVRMKHLVPATMHSLAWGEPHFQDSSQILSHSHGEIKSGRRPGNKAIAVCVCRSQVFHTPNITPGLAMCSGMNQVFQCITAEPGMTLGV